MIRKKTGNTSLRDCSPCMEWHCVGLPHLKEYQLFRKLPTEWNCIESYFPLISFVYREICGGNLDIAHMPKFIWKAKTYSCWATEANEIKSKTDLSDVVCCEKALQMCYLPMRLNYPNWPKVSLRHSCFTRSTLSQLPGNEILSRYSL